LMAIHPDRVRPTGAGSGTGVISGRVVGMRPDGARIDVEVEADGEWLGRFHWLAGEPPSMGTGLHFRAADPPVFGGPEAVLD